MVDRLVRPDFRPGDDDTVPVVPFVAFRCPRCGRHNPFTDGVIGRLRYHVCQNCGLKYKSYELPATAVRDWGGELPREERI
jgi:DNA-directed RNA polymerase subunit RPC12/RpoP